MLQGFEESGKYSNRTRDNTRELESRYCHPSPPLGWRLMCSNLLWNQTSLHFVTTRGATLHGVSLGGYNMARNPALQAGFYKAVYSLCLSPFYVCWEPSWTAESTMYHFSILFGHWSCWTRVSQLQVYSSYDKCVEAYLTLNKLQNILYFRCSNHKPQLSLEELTEYLNYAFQFLILFLS